jgi:hypothetical protein
MTMRCILREREKIIEKQLDSIPTLITLESWGNVFIERRTKCIN